MGPFRGNQFYLSNFYSAPLEYEGHKYPTSEHAYVASKAKTEDGRRSAQVAESPADAKQIGKRIEIREDWEDIKVRKMLEILWCKFDQNPELAERLIATGTKNIVERNWWHDTYWGVDIDTGKGQNWLGKCLMAVRNKLKEKHNK